MGWPGLYTNARSCGVLSMILLKLEDPLELFAKSREFLLGFGISSHRDLTKAVTSAVKTFVNPLCECLHVRSYLF